MKKLIILAIGLCYSLSLMAQSNSIVQHDSVFSSHIVDVLPSFTSENFNSGFEYIFSKLVYPEEMCLTGEVGASFVITKNGEVKDIKVVKHLIEECDSQVIEILRTMPKWIPGKKDGKNVNTKMYLTFKFTVR